MLDVKKTLLTALLSTMMVAPTFAAEGEDGGEEPEPTLPGVTSLTVQGGTVNFKGSIVNTPCVVDVESSNQTVNLGQFQTVNFEGAGSTSAPVNFNINLISCDTETMNTAAIAFKGPTIEGDVEKLSPLATEASDTIASGVGIQILQDSKILKVDGSEAAESVKLLDGSNKLAFQAQYVATGESLTVGSANSSADFTVTYN